MYHFCLNNNELRKSEISCKIQNADILKISIASIVLYAKLTTPFPRSNILPVAFFRRVTSDMLSYGSCISNYRSLRKWRNLI